MAVKSQIIEVRQFKGLNTIDDSTAIDPAESSYTINMDITKNGSMQSRYGYEKVCDISGSTGAMRGIMAYYKTYDSIPGDTDQSDDTGGAYSNTYTCPVTISESATNKKAFTPTKTNVLRIGVWVVAKGTDNLTITLHDSSNNSLASDTLQNSEITNGQFNYLDLPYTIGATPLHFHVLSPGGTLTIKTNTAGDLSTCSFNETYSTKGKYLILFSYDGSTYVKIHYITDTSTTPVLIGNYGEDNGVVRGIQFNNLAIFGNGGVHNVVEKWDGTTLANLGGNPPSANIFGTFGKRLFLAGIPQNKSKVVYSDADTPETFGGSSFINVNIGDGQDITNLTNNNDFLQVYKTDSVYGINFSFDSSYVMTVPQLQPIISAQAGAISPDSVQAIYGYTFYLYKFGVNTYGPNPQRIIADMPVPLSMKIDPTIANINYYSLDQISSAFYDNKYILSVPLGGDRKSYYALVYNENVKRRFGFDNWVMYKGIPSLQYANFKNSKNKEELYFVSNTEPSLFKFNKTFSDNGFGYDRIWTSKLFQYGENTSWDWLYLEGYKTVGSTIYVDMVTDQINSETVTITDENFVTAGIGGGYIGENYTGDEYIGGGFESSGGFPMYKWRKRIRMPSSINQGNTFYFKLRNNAENEGWSLTRYRLRFTPLTDDVTFANTEN